MGIKGFLALIGTGALVVVGSLSLFQVYENQQALVLQFGSPRATHTEPGLKFKMPWQNVVYLDRRILNLDVPAEEVIASDQKRLLVDAFARFRIVNPLLVYQSATNERGVQDRLTTIIRSQLRQNLGRQSFATLLSSERSNVMRQITEAANVAAADLGAEVVDVRIKRADLPRANSDAIYRRMQTERQREAAEARARGEEEALNIRAEADREVTVLLAEARRNAEVMRGEGDGTAIKIFADAFGKDEEFFAFYRSMQAYKQALGSGDTTMVLSPDSEFFRYFGREGSEKKR